MKSCERCHAKNEDSATRCVECGDEGFHDAAATEAPQEGDSSTPAFTFRGIGNDPVRLFRALVIVSNGAFVLAALAPYFESRFLASETLDLLARSGEGALLTLPTGILWLALFLNLAVALGLYHFSAAARTVLTFFIVAFTTFGLLGGVYVNSPVVGFLSEVTTYADGAILLLAYATPLKKRFQ